jgi:predicted ATP-dependent serine protease
MAKVKTQFVCQQCGRVMLRQMGRCPQCGTYNSMVEQIVAEPKKGDDRRPVGAATSAPKRLRQIEGDVESRQPIPIEEFARVLGGGEFVYCELMKYNEVFMERIQAAKSSKELLKIWRDRRKAHS